MCTLRVLYPPLRPRTLFALPPPLRRINQPLWGQAPGWRAVGGKLSAPELSADRWLRLAFPFGGFPPFLFRPVFFSSFPLSTTNSFCSKTQHLRVVSWRVVGHSLGLVPPPRLFSAAAYFDSPECVETTPPKFRFVTLPDSVVPPAGSTTTGRVISHFTRIENLKGDLVSLRTGNISTFTRS